MQRTISNMLTILGVTMLFLLLLAVVMVFFGRQYVKPLLPESLGEMLFPPLPTRVESNFDALFTPPELSATPSSVVRAARQWAEDRGWEYCDCERIALPYIRGLKSPALYGQSRVYDDTDYATCLRYVRARATDRNADGTLSERYLPGEWLPGRRLGDQARRDFEAIIERRPDFFYATYLLGCWHRQNGDIETATHYFEQAYTAAPVVLVLSFDLIELHESWEQNRPPRVTLVNNRTFAHDIDLTYHYGVDDCATVRYPYLRADANGLVLIPAEREWLTWERRYYPDLPAAGQSNQKFDTSWRFRGQSKVALLQHDELIVRPYDTNPMRTDPFFDPIWGTQQSLGVYERVATYCESQRALPLLYSRQTEMVGKWDSGKVGETTLSHFPTFPLSQSGTVRATDGARIALIDTCNPLMLTWYLQQTGLTRNGLIAKMQAWFAEHTPDDEITLPPDTGVVLAVVADDHSAWLVKIAPAPDGSYAVTTLRIGSLP